jgi:hypothetical protein
MIYYQQVEVPDRPMVAEGSYIGWSYDQIQGPITFGYANSPINGTRNMYLHSGQSLTVNNTYTANEFIKPYFFSIMADMEFGK